MKKMKKLRVANILEEAQIGGPQLRVTIVADKIRNEIETTVILPIKNSTNFEYILTNKKIKYKKVFLSKITKKFTLAAKYILLSPFELILLISYFRKKKFDIIHISGGAWQFKSMIAAKLSNTKVIWHLNDTYMPKFIRLIFYLLRNYPDAYIFSSNKTKLYYSNILKDVNNTQVVIQAPVDTKFFKPIKNFKPKNILNDKIIVGTIGNISSVKGIDIFIEIASKLNCISSNFEFRIIGLIPVTQKKYYKKLIKLINKNNLKNIKFIGNVENTKSYLDDFDIYLCTSRYESSPLSVWEAMSMRKVVISSDVGDVGHFLNSNDYDSVVNVGNVEGYIINIMKFVKDQDLSYKYGLYLRDISKKYLDINICSNNHKKIYRKLKKATK